VLEKRQAESSDPRSLPCRQSTCEHPTNGDDSRILNKNTYPRGEATASEAEAEPVIPSSRADSFRERSRFVCSFVESFLLEGHGGRWGKAYVSIPSLP
jgi:hypothetical protein